VSDREVTLEHLRAAIEGRKSVRGYKTEPIARDRLEALFAAAQRAPSWCNIQPWRVTVTAPPVTGQVAEALTRAATSGMPAPEIPFPIEYPEPYRAHRRACGHALYGAMGITRDDKSRRYEAWLRNYGLFDAPHLAVVARDRNLGEYATLDVGVWLGVFLATAAVMGIDTCPMASVAAYPEPLRRILDIPDDQVVLFGIAIGHEDPDVPANACRTERSPVADNVRFLGF
jgi:nitroreductase